MGTNINGPALLRVPDWVPAPLGRYYLYFSHHNGTYIRLAVADRIAGPWRIHGPGVLDLNDSLFHEHIASPEIHVDAQARRIWLYYHGVTDQVLNGHKVQASRVALSSDGLHFQVRAPILGAPYMRVFGHDGAVYALAYRARFLRSPDGLEPFQDLGIPADFPPNIRHVGLWRRAPDRLTVFYSAIGAAPEAIRAFDWQLTGGSADWRAGPDFEVLRPQFEYEGAAEPMLPSEPAAVDKPVHQLRDPDILVDRDGKIYMPYVTAGEAGIALAELKSIG